MSLSAWEQQALDSIKDGLAGTDPKLAALLATFDRLASGEEMPAARRSRRADGGVLTGRAANGSIPDAIQCAGTCAGLALARASSRSRCCCASWQLSG